jgi:lipoprotein-anchoring transpeptidase ErfK/SrfK
MTAREACRRDFRARAARRRPGSTLVGLLLALLVLAGCQFGDAPGAAPSGHSGGVTVAGAATPGPQPAGTATAVPAPTLHLPDGPVPFQEPVSVSVDDGQITAVAARSGDGLRLPGTVAPDGTRWTSTERPRPGARYDLTVQARAVDGVTHALTGSVAVAVPPKAERLTLAVQPPDGAVVGVGAPVVVRFDQSVTDRAAVEGAFEVAASVRVTGAWHWVSDREVHFRPESYWPAGTKVAVRLALTGVPAGKDLWGGRDYVNRFTVGAAHIATIDGAKHTMTVTVDGKNTATWPVSLGRPEFATRTGTYVVLSKDRVRQMTSCNANITCDRASPNWYDLPVHWSVRLTWSGTFIHAAPWSANSQGRANVSHGCINLSVARGKAYYDMSRYGDVVTVINTSRPADDLVKRGDPGMADWNLSFADYAAGSALHRVVLTAALPA